MDEKELKELNEATEEMKKDPKRLKKAFDNVGKILPFIRKLQIEAKKEVFDDIDKLLILLRMDLKLMLKKEDKSACVKLDSVISELEYIKKRHL